MVLLVLLPTGVAVCCMLLWLMLLFWLLLLHVVVTIAVVARAVVACCCRYCSLSLLLLHVVVSIVHAIVARGARRAIDRRPQEIAKHWEGVVDEIPKKETRCDGIAPSWCHVQ